MTLRDLLGEGPDVEITGLAFDNRAVRPGTLFFCVPGFTRDGHDFAPDAVGAARRARRRAAARARRSRGPGRGRAAAMAAPRRASTATPRRGCRSSGSRAPTARRRPPSSCARCWRRAGCRAGCSARSRPWSAARSARPCARRRRRSTCRRRSAAMLDGGDRACAMEVSSHALELRRVDGDPLRRRRVHEPQPGPPRLPSRHGGLLRGQAAAVPRVRRRRARIVVRGRRMGPPAGRRAPGRRHRRRSTAPADWRRGDAAPGSAAPPSPSSRRRARPRSAAAARAASTPPTRWSRWPPAHALGAPAGRHGRRARGRAAGAGARAAGRGGAGRSPCSSTTRTSRPRWRTCCAPARELATGRVIVVFGAGGDRDRGKRPLMGEIAARLADVAIVTSDNPRSEDAGGDHRRDHGRDPGRRASAWSGSPTAARRSTARSRWPRPGDVVVIAGKGHEQGQEFAGGRKEPFDDVAVAREALRRGVRVRDWSDARVARGRRRRARARRRGRRRPGRGW